MNSSFSQHFDLLENELNKNDPESIYKLGITYYELFITAFKYEKEKSEIDHYARSATNCLMDLFTISDNLLEKARYPLIQLSEYFKDSIICKKLKDSNYQSSYFPISAFIELPEGWETNFNINIMHYHYGINGAFSSINRYSKYLKALNEPVLSDTLSTKIYRFLYLRTFDNPIVIRLENHNDIVSIYWKVSNGSGGYESGEIILNESKELTIEEWRLIENKINSINFWNLETTETEIMGIDGSRWILEGKYLGKYKVVDRWCGGDILSICLELINLSDLKIEKNKQY